MPRRRSTSHNVTFPAERKIPPVPWLLLSPQRPIAFAGSPFWTILAMTWGEVSAYGSRTTPQSACSADSSPDKGSLWAYRSRWGSLWAYESWWGGGGVMTPPYSDVWKSDYPSGRNQRFRPAHLTRGAFGRMEVNGGAFGRMEVDGGSLWAYGSRWGSRWAYGSRWGEGGSRPSPTGGIWKL